MASYRYATRPSHGDAIAFDHGGVDVPETLAASTEFRVSIAAAAQVDGFGLARGGNVGDGVSVFEATHGTPPKYVSTSSFGDEIIKGTRA